LEEEDIEERAGGAHEERGRVEAAHALAAVGGNDAVGEVGGEVLGGDEAVDGGVEGAGLEGVEFVDGGVERDDAGAGGASVGDQDGEGGLGLAEVVGEGDAGEGVSRTTLRGVDELVAQGAAPALRRVVSMSVR
jgi:hypothetical protein